MTLSSLVFSAFSQDGWKVKKVQKCMEEALKGWLHQNLKNEQKRPDDKLHLAKNRI